MGRLWLRLTAFNKQAHGIQRGHTASQQYLFSPGVHWVWDVTYCYYGSVTVLAGGWAEGKVSARGRVLEYVFRSLMYIDTFAYGKLDSTFCPETRQLCHDLEDGGRKGTNTTTRTTLERNWDTLKGPEKDPFTGGQFDKLGLAGSIRRALVNCPCLKLGEV